MSYNVLAIRAPDDPYESLYPSLSQALAGSRLTAVQMETMWFSSHLRRFTSTKATTLIR